MSGLPVIYEVKWWPRLPKRLATELFECCSQGAHWEEGADPGEASAWDVLQTAI